MTIDQKEKKASIAFKNKKRGKSTEKRVLKQLEDYNLKAYRLGVFGKEDLILMVNDKVFSCEVKNRKKLAFIDWYEQAVSNAKQNQIPIVLCTKYYSKKFFVIIDLDDFIKVIKE